MSEEKLLPCPFCGRPARQRDISESFANGWVGCQYCKVFIDWLKNGKPDAVAAWNRRAEAGNAKQEAQK